MCLERRVPVSKFGLRRVKGPAGVRWFEAFKVFRVIRDTGGALQAPIFGGKCGQMSSGRAYSPAPTPARLLARPIRHFSFFYPAGFHCFTKRPQATQYLYRAFLNQDMPDYCLRRVLVRDVRAAGYQGGRRVIVVGRMFICKEGK